MITGNERWMRLLGAETAGSHRADVADTAKHLHAGRGRTITPMRRRLEECRLDYARPALRERSQPSRRKQQFTEKRICFTEIFHLNSRGQGVRALIGNSSSLAVPGDAEPAWNFTNTAISEAARGRVSAGRARQLFPVFDEALCGPASNSIIARPIQLVTIAAVMAKGNQKAVRADHHPEQCHAAATSSLCVVVDRMRLIARQIWRRSVKRARNEIQIVLELCPFENLHNAVHGFYPNSIGVGGGKPIFGAHHDRDWHDDRRRSEVPCCAHY